MLSQVNMTLTQILILLSNLKCQKLGAQVPVPDLPGFNEETFSSVARKIGRVQAVYLRWNGCETQPVA
jgi:hypothetical protein